MSQEENKGTLLPKALFPCQLLTIFYFFAAFLAALASFLAIFSHSFAPNSFCFAVNSSAIFIEAASSSGVANACLYPFTSFQCPRVKSGKATAAQPLSIEIAPNSAKLHHSAKSYTSISKGRPFCRQYTKRESMMKSIRLLL